MLNATHVHDRSIGSSSHRARVPAIFDDYARYLARRVGDIAGERVLEIACGNGVLTRHLSDTLDDSVRLVATDLNPEMVDAAFVSVGDPSVDFRPAEVTALPFDDDSFDVVVCQFGVMFFDDKLRGYHEVSRVLKPGGRFVFNVWDSLDRNRLCALVRDEMTRLMPSVLPTFDGNPFAYNRISTITDDLRRAGFSSPYVTVMPLINRARNAHEMALALIVGSWLGTELDDQGMTDAALEAVRSRVIDMFGDGEVRAPMQSIVFEAELPVDPTTASVLRH